MTGFVFNSQRRGLSSKHKGSLLILPHTSANGCRSSLSTICVVGRAITQCSTLYSGRAKKKADWTPSDRTFAQRLSWFTGTAYFLFSCCKFKFCHTALLEVTWPISRRKAVQPFQMPTSFSYWKIYILVDRFMRHFLPRKSIQA